MQCILKINACCFEKVSKQFIHICCKYLIYQSISGMMADSEMVTEIDGGALEGVCFSPQF